jgi:hypothetical protein
MLGPLVVLGIGFGLVFFPTTLVAVSGAARSESGLASALLNVSQQLGGSIGLAVLGTVAVTVTRSRLVDLRPTHELVSQSITAGFATAFEIGAVIALGGFVLAALVIRVRAPKAADVALREAA